MNPFRHYTSKNKLPLFRNESLLRRRMQDSPIFQISYPPAPPSLRISYPLPPSNHQIMYTIAPSQGSIQSPISLTSTNKLRSSVSIESWLTSDKSGFLWEKQLLQKTTSIKNESRPKSSRKLDVEPPPINAQKSRYLETREPLIYRTDMTVQWSKLLPPVYKNRRVLFWNIIVRHGWLSLD